MDLNPLVEQNRPVTAASAGGMALVEHLDELTELVGAAGPAYVRFSAGPEADAQGTSRDGESGATLPGLSVNRLQPEPWWDRPPRVWVARQLMQYAHLGAGDGRVAWVLTGREVGRGPDSEPLVADVVPMALLAPGVLDEAVSVYRENLATGRLPDGP
ncbi:DUF6098 family protein [Cellulomonas xylanilytica]|uniref:Uncharacterized protein n=1 Tax=Cellulomonas xylanilytica TaxID=233583 RepID=A0A510V981_9CELL|nr:DUF6098 family protein [Cellulomonas xylanilytica]GEK23434.1 hypothetical protein CXY01_39540 [Cellulomonas xylanilytica]